MAVIPGPNGIAAGAESLTTDEENILDFSKLPRNGATTIKIIAEADSPGNVMVRIPMMHADKWAILFPGESEVFRLGDSEMATCYCKASSGTATMRWRTISMT